MKFKFINDLELKIEHYDEDAFYHKDIKYSKNEYSKNDIRKLDK